MIFIVAILLFTIFVATIKGIKHLWLVGDNFVASTIREHYLEKEMEEGWFSKENYEISHFCNSKYTSKNKNVLSRIQITIADAINDKIVLPDVLVIVLHRDIVNTLQIDDVESCSTVFGTWLKWIINKLDEMVEERYSKLPEKAKRYPVIYWASIPVSKHLTYTICTIHARFNHTLETILKLFPKMRMIKYREAWSIDDSSLVINTGSTKLADKGLSAFWETLDASLKFNLAKRSEFLAKQNGKFKEKMSGNHDQEDKMSQIFERRRVEFPDNIGSRKKSQGRLMYDKFHWSKDDLWREDQHRVIHNRNNRFLLPHPH